MNIEGDDIARLRFLESASTALLIDLPTTSRHLSREALLHGSLSKPTLRCMACGSILIPGLTCAMRTKRLKTAKADTAQRYMGRQCFACSRITRTRFHAPSRLTAPPAFPRLLARPPTITATAAKQDEKQATNGSTERRKMIAGLKAAVRTRRALPPAKSKSTTFDLEDLMKPGG